MLPKNIKIQKIEIHPDDALFVIGVVSELTGMPIWTIRRLDEMGLVSPKRVNKKNRYYTHRQINKIVYIYHLMKERSVNMSGIKVILEIEKGE